MAVSRPDLEVTRHFPGPGEGLTKKMAPSETKRRSTSRTATGSTSFRKGPARYRKTTSSDMAYSKRRLPRLTGVPDRIGLDQPTFGAGNFGRPPAAQSSFNRLTGADTEGGPTLRFRRRARPGSAKGRWQTQLPSPMSGERGEQRRHFTDRRNGRTTGDRSRRVGAIGHSRPRT